MQNLDITPLFALNNQFIREESFPSFLNCEAGAKPNFLGYTVEPLLTHTPQWMVQAVG